MTIDNIPEWVPDAAKRLVATVHVDNPFLHRFLCDPRMEDVWNTLQQFSPKPNWRKQVDSDGIISCIDYGPTEHPSDVDFSCAGFCWVLVQTTGDVYQGKPIARIETHLNKVAKPYDEVVEKCAFLKRNEDFWGIPLSPDLIEAIDKVSKHAAQRSTLIRQQDKPFVLKRSSKERGDNDAVRAWTVRIGHGMITIWGRLSYSSLATIAEVLFELEYDPERRDAVKKWCQDIAGNKGLF